MSHALARVMPRGVQCALALCMIQSPISRVELGKRLRRIKLRHRYGCGPATVEFFVVVDSVETFKDRFPKGEQNNKSAVTLVVVVVAAIVVCISCIERSDIVLYAGRDAYVYIYMYIYI